MTNNSQLTDQELAAAIAQGSIAAFDQLYERHWRPLLSYLLGQLGDQTLAEEVLQDVMLAVWRGAARFRGECGVRTWMIAIARKKALNARQRGAPGAYPLPEDLIGTGPSLSEAVERHALEQAVELALDELPAEQRETLDLIFYHGMTGPEAAAVMEVAVGTVRSRLKRAKEKLRLLLKQEDPSHA